MNTLTCGQEEMFTYQRRMAACLAQCNESKRVRLQKMDGMEHPSKLRGLQAGSAEERKLGVTGLMDALPVVTINNTLGAMLALARLKVKGQVVTAVHYAL
ncbi:uncharacterized protein KRP23_9060 [Phytophthora ramorum]|uniref:uncharacterized protein n=1 Tax=Phytophthora ramorum TaxID=164328 RepID=UPI0030AA1850|nr:hypothetical protein KRP23_9060 [Phytophthora ramorum]